jgi:pseudolysin
LIYENLAKDLPMSLKKIPNADRAEMAMATGIQNFTAKPGTVISQKKNELMIYVDDNQKAHYAYLASFFAQPEKGLPAIPTFIIDAENFKIYKQWDNIQTSDGGYDGGGLGGNPKMGQHIYDGLPGHLPKLNITRFETHCGIFNKDVVVIKANTSKVMSFECVNTDPAHNNVYWNGNFDQVNEGYSPANDAMYTGEVVKNMYQNWYGIPVLTNERGPMKLTMAVHDDMENAYWYGSQMVFGDGGPSFYPLVSLGVGAHEISHGFTEQHSNLTYQDQSGGLNESFSDMAAQAAEFYSNGASSWLIGAEIMKDDGVLRYMDKPSKDCGSRRPGRDCSIDNARQYHAGLDVHYSSGVYNRAFYLMANTPGWDTKKAFDVMVAANRFYWIPNATFASAACGVLSATHDLGYPENDVKQVFNQVGISTMHC